MKKTLTAIAIAIALCMTMAAQATTNEITTQVYLQASKGNVQLSRAPGTVLVQMAGTRFHSYIQAVTTAWLPLSKGSVGSMGYSYLRNLNGSNTVYLSFDVGANTNLSLKAGEVTLLRLYAAGQITNIHARAAIASDLEVTILED